MYAIYYAIAIVVIISKVNIGIGHGNCFKGHLAWVVVVGVTIVTSVVGTLILETIHTNHIVYEVELAKRVFLIKVAHTAIAAIVGVVDLVHQQFKVLLRLLEAKIGKLHQYE